jgi:hypothetical protein
MQAFGVEVKGVPTIVVLKPKKNGQGMTKVLPNPPPSPIPPALMKM